MMWLLKSLFNQNLIMINHKSNGDFNRHIILSMTQVGLLELLVKVKIVWCCLLHKMCPFLSLKKTIKAPVLTKKS